MKRLNKVLIEWTPNFAYAIGLIATDGNLSKDGRHLNMTSKDRDMILTFKNCLGLKNKIGRKTREKSKIKRYFQVQFGDKNFYEFLLSIGLTPAKSKTIGALNIPEDYFIDFFRGCIDGDGNISVASHPESRHPQLRLRLFSASPLFLNWVKGMIFKLYKIKTGWIETKEDISVLIYAKTDSIKLLNLMYYPKVESYLGRKHAIAEQFLGE